MISSGKTETYDVRQPLKVSAALMIAGLLLSAWSWDIGQTLGVPLMLMAVAFPFVDAYRAWQRDRALPMAPPPLLRRARGNHARYELQSHRHRGYHDAARRAL